MTLRKSLFYLLVALTLGAGVWYFWPAGSEAPGEPQGGRRRGRMAGSEGPVSVLVAPVQARDVPVYRDGIGNIQAFALVTVRSQIDGLLTSVEFREGDMVKRGQVLARIDPTILKAQLDQAMAKKAQDQANLANARVDLARYQQLAASNAGPKQQADQQRAAVAQLEAQLRADDAAIETARANLAYTVITSPLEGRAGLRQVDAGNIIRAGDAAGLVSVAQVQPISALFTLPQRDLAITAAALAQGAVGVEALDADGKTVLATGRLEVIDNQVDTTTGTIRLKASFPNTDGKLWPGQFVSVRVRVAELKGARVVPTPAIRRGPQGTFVYGVGEGEKATLRPVSVIQQDETSAVIASGVEVGDRVITAGFNRLVEGRVVSVSTEGEGATPPSARPRGPRSEGQRGDGQRGEGGQRQRRPPEGQGAPRGPAP